jgi:acetyl-CoA synthetase
VHGALVSQYLTARRVLDLRPDDVYWCNADPGWVTGTSYGIIGPWANGVTQVVLDAGFSAGRWYEFLQRHRVTVVLGADRDPAADARGAELARATTSSLRHLAAWASR